MKSKPSMIALASTVLAALLTSSATGQAPATSAPGSSTSCPRRPTSCSGSSKPLAATPPPTVGPYRTAAQPADEQVALAKGLNAQYVTREAGNATDMMVLFPTGRRATSSAASRAGGPPSRRASSIPPSSGSIWPRGGRDDPARHERVRRYTHNAVGDDPRDRGADDGGAYEILESAVGDQRQHHRPRDRRGQRPDPCRQAHRATDDGVGGDRHPAERHRDRRRRVRPGTDAPDRRRRRDLQVRAGDAVRGRRSIASLAASPFVSGSVYAMQVSWVDNAQQFGQGCEVGQRGLAAGRSGYGSRRGATPKAPPVIIVRKIFHQDPSYVDANDATAVRFCWTDTQDEDAWSFGEVMYAVDSEPLPRRRPRGP